MDGEECEFESVTYAGFVVDRAEIVFDDLLSSFEAGGDFAIFAALHDEGDDAHFLGCESIAHSASDEVFFGRLGDYQLRGHPDITHGDSADALDEGIATDVAEDDATEAELEVGIGGVRVFSDDDAAAAGGVEHLAHAGHVRAQGSGEQDDGSGKGGDGVEQPFEVGALGNDAQLVVRGEYLGCARAEYSLRIRKNNSIHEMRLILASAVEPRCDPCSRTLPPILREVFRLILGVGLPFWTCRIAESACSMAYRQRRTKVYADVPNVDNPLGLSASSPVEIPGYFSFIIKKYGDLMKRVT